MGEEQVHAELKRLESEMKRAQAAVIQKWAIDNSPYKLGDIISGNGSIIKVDRIQGSLSYGDLKFVLTGVALRKDLQPMKSGERQIIWVSKDTKLIKSFEPVKTES